MYEDFSHAEGIHLSESLVTFKPCSRVTSVLGVASNVTKFKCQQVMVFTLHICVFKNRTTNIKEKRIRRLDV